MLARLKAQTLNFFQKLGYPSPELSQTGDGLRGQESLGLAAMAR